MLTMFKKFSLEESMDVQSDVRSKKRGAQMSAEARFNENDQENITESRLNQLANQGHPSFQEPQATPRDLTKAPDAPRKLKKP